MNTGAPYEIAIDGTTRTYRDRKDMAIEAATQLKAKSPPRGHRLLMHANASARTEMHPHASPRVGGRSATGGRVYFCW
jgi:hypothetical protein